MKTAISALTPLLSSAGTDVHAAPGARPGGQGFSLATAEQASEWAQRLKQTKEQHAQTPHDPQDAQAMLAMLAMLLTQTPQAAKTAGPDGQPANNVAVHLAQKHARVAAPPVKPGTMGVQAQQTNRAPAGVKPQELPAQLQKLFAQMTASGEVTLTPEQQARLAELRARDPKQIAPAQEAHPQVSATAARAAPAPAPIAAAHRATVKEKIAERHAIAPAASAALPTLPAINSARADGMETSKTLPLMPQSDELGEKLNNLLKDRIHFQIDQQQQISTIRLDPPSLGKLDIAIQMEAGKLTVHIGASQPEVCRSLQQLSEQLRQQLTGQNFAQVEVHVSADGGRDQQQQQQQRHPHQDDEILTARTIPSSPNDRQQRDPLLIKV